MQRIHYIDFDLKISRSGRRYIASIDSPAGEAAREFKLPFSPLELENLTLKLSRMRNANRGIDSPEIAAARELGGKLFREIFQDQVGYCFRASVEKARAQPVATGLRVKLRIDDAPKLFDLPWEFLFDPDMHRFLAQSNFTPIIRYVDLPVSVSPLKTDLPVRVLGMVSSPVNYHKLDVEHEESLLQQALAPLLETGQLAIDWLDQATLPALHKALRKQDYHIFHFIGHGGFDESTEQGVLVMEDEQERGSWASADRLGVLFHDHPSLRLAVLNACEGARNSPTDPFAGVATTLVRQGLPAVIAMQFEISDEAAITFASEFYTALAQGYPVDQAVAEARKSIYMTNDVEWGTPVVYLRSADGVLFDLSQVAAPEAASTDVKMRTQPEMGASQPMPGAPPSEKPTTQSAPAGPVAPYLDHKPVASQAILPPVLHDLSPKLLHTLEGHTDCVWSIDFSSDGRLLASAAGDHTIRLWQVEDGNLLRMLEGHTDCVWSIAFSPDDRLLASGSDDATLRLWQVEDGKPLRTLEGHTDRVRNIAFSPDGRSLASGSDDDTIRLWQVEDGNLLYKLEGHSGHVNEIAFSPTGRLLASASSDTALRLWEVENGNLLHKLEGHTDWVWCVVFSPDGRWLASGAYDNTVRLWQVEGGNLLHTLEGHTDWVWGIAFSPDGSWLASSSGDNTIRLWQVEDGKPLHTLEGHTGLVRSIAFSLDGRLLASASDDGTLRLWLVEDGNLLHTLKGHIDRVRSVVFSPDGRLLASASDDKTVRLWQLW
jgi:WD40 repeat protein